jgi:hypothetical protein
MSAFGIETERIDSLIAQNIPVLKLDADNLHMP